MNLAGEARGWEEGWIRSPEEGRRCRASGTAGKPPRAGQGEGGARRPLTLATLAWAQIMLPSARRLESGGARAPHGGLGAGTCGGTGTPAGSRSARRSGLRAGGGGERAALRVCVCARGEGRLGQRRTVFRLQQGRLMRGNAAHFERFILPPAPPPCLPAPLWVPDSRANHEPG